MNDQHQEYVDHATHAAFTGEAPVDTTTDLQARLDAIAAYTSHPGNWGASDGRGRLIYGLATGAINPATTNWSNTELPRKEPR